jgi:DNA-binding helix-hairpin-helix protein with protein kinase domain
MEISGSECTVEDFVGEGGEGQVYRVSTGGRNLALKWYHPGYQQNDPHLRQRIKSITETNPPNERFIWPMELVSAEKLPSFGYVMPFLDPRFRSMKDLVSRRIAETPPYIDPTFRTLTTAGMHLAEGYLRLHTGAGLSFRDVSWNNCRIDPQTGDIAIFDNDNVGKAGTPCGVAGTLDFMAPELMRYFGAAHGWGGGAEARRLTVYPSIRTDLHALAVLLFRMFMIDHPLLGKRDTGCLDEYAIYQLFGESPLFIFDPIDDSNAPDPVDHYNSLANWAIYPKFFKALFLKAFTTGLHDPANGRVVESVWRNAMIRLRDSIIYCPKCKVETFADIDMLDKPDSNTVVCWSCQQKVQLPARIRIQHGNRNVVVMLNHDTKLYPHHMDVISEFDFSTPIAEVSQHPTITNLFGLKNLSKGKWTYVPPGGTTTDLEPGRSLKIVNGTTVYFGTISAEILV